MIDPASFMGRFLHNIGLNSSDIEKRSNMITWNKWFAWFPVKAEGRIIWLTYVERRYNMHNHTNYWSYRVYDKNRSEYEERMRKERFNKNIHNGRFGR